jgi:hypothetical protein
MVKLKIYLFLATAFLFLGLAIYAWYAKPETSPLEVGFLYLFVAVDSFCVAALASLDMENKNG